MPSRRHLLAAAPALALALAGCSTGSNPGGTDAAAEPTSTTSADPDAFPVTIEHALGETTIESEPTRVATLGWTDHDHALALGVVPVGATKITWGGNDGGSTDWFDAAVEEAGAEAPVRYDDADGAPIDEVAELAPDLILGDQLRHHRGGVRQALQDRAGRRLPGAPWTTPWQTSLEMVGEALGTALAEDVAADTQRSTRPPRPTPSSRGTRATATSPPPTSPPSACTPPRTRACRSCATSAWSTRRRSPTPSRPVRVLRHGLRRAGGRPRLRRVPHLGRLARQRRDDRERQAARPDPRDRRGGHWYAETDKQNAMASTDPALSIPVIVSDFLPHVVGRPSRADDAAPRHEGTTSPGTTSAREGAGRPRPAGRRRVSIVAAGPGRRGALSLLVGAQRCRSAAVWDAAHP